MESYELRFGCYRIKTWYIYDEQEARALAEHLKSQGASVDLIPIADEFRRFGDTRPVKVKWLVVVK